MAIALCIMLFAFSFIIGNYYSNIEFLNGGTFRTIQRKTG
ncbi:hypothetical protein [uncultured Ilyobacter sp.]